MMAERIEASEYAEALQHFTSVCQNAAQEQEMLLRHILEVNRNTEFGRKMGFAGLLDFQGPKLRAEYQKRVPILTYGDYKPYIDRMICGEKDLIMAGKPVCYCVTSGTTDQNKYIPVSKEDIFLQDLYWNQVFKAQMMEETGCSESQLFGCIFQINEIFQTWMPEETLLCVRTGADQWYRENHGGMDVSGYTAPHGLFFPRKIVDLTYVKVCFALANSKVTGIQGTFVHGIVSLLRFIEENWTDLLDDLEKGRVNERFEVPAEWRKYLKENLAISEERIKELRRIPVADLRDGMLLKIWPKIRYIRAISNDSYSLYVESLSAYAKGVLYHSFIYSSSESNFGIAVRADGTNEYVLPSDMCYYEFIPAEEAEEGEPGENATYGISDLKTGENYELIITTLSGLYRYRIGDVIQVVGRYGEALVIKVGYRRGTTISIADEMVHENQYVKAVNEFLWKRNIRAEEYCLAGRFTGTIPSYLLFLETEDGIDHTDEKILDRCFSKYNDSYEEERILRHLDCLAIQKVRMGTFAEYRKAFQTKGISRAQVKPVRVLKNKEQVDFFLEHISK